MDSAISQRRDALAKCEYSFKLITAKLIVFPVFPNKSKNESYLYQNHSLYNR